MKEDLKKILETCSCPNVLEGPLYAVSEMNCSDWVKLSVPTLKVYVCCEDHRGRAAKDTL